MCWKYYASRLEDAQVTIARAAMTLTFPARFMLAAAMNPCPCGWMSDPQRTCLCSAQQIQRYNARVSGPLLDRIDIHVDVPPVHYADLASPQRRRPRRPSAPASMRRGPGNTSALPARPCRIMPPWACGSCGATVSSTPPEQQLLAQAMRHYGLSARAHDRICKVARTIADLAGTEEITAAHVAEAIQYRTLDRQ